MPYEQFKEVGEEASFITKSKMGFRNFVDDSFWAFLLRPGIAQELVKEKESDQKN